ncbi:sulfatase-like hydrolase/transferase [bacterium]|nr:sulfatase-like hydrolase/transferase [bacterium]
MNRIALGLILIAVFFLFGANSEKRTQYNVLLISIDTLRADALGCYGNPQKTPAMDSFANRSVLFENTISQAPLTLPSHATILTGLFPPQHGIRNNEIFVLPEKITTLAEVFQKNGYKTGAVVGSFALDSGFGMAQGFDQYDDQIDPGSNSETPYVERRADAVWQRGHQWIAEQKSPWFFFLHFYDPHTAYAPPKAYPQTYSGEVAYVDSVLSQAFEYLRNANLYSTTVIVLISDHGESLGEHGEASHGVFLYDATLKVPLMISSPGLKSSRISQVVRLVDVAPTILALAGLPPFPSQTGPEGISLVPIMRGQQKDLPAYSETYYTNLLMGWAPLRSIRTGQFKWIDAPTPELYNLSSDPNEKKNLYASGSVPLSMKREMDRFAATKPIAAQDMKTDPEVRERLASLGYITGSSSIPEGSATFDPKNGIQTWEKIEAAVTSAQLGKLPEAEKGLKDALSDQPDNVIAQKFLANVLAKEKKDDEAIEYLKKAMNSKLHQEETRVDLAKLLYAKKEYAQTLETVLPVAGKTTQNAVALKLAGLSAAHDKQYDAASDFLERALQLSPKDPDCLSTQAAILSHLNRDQDALEKYRTLESVRTLTDEESVQVAAIYITEKDFVNAENYFQKAIDANPKSLQAWRGIALIRASQQKWQDSIDAFVKADDCQSAKSILSKHPELSKTEFETKCPAPSNK